jgi:hypothetical protein
MPSPETLQRFIAKVESNKHDEAIAEFYTEDASMRENQGLSLHRFGSSPA